MGGEDTEYGRIDSLQVRHRSTFLSFEVLQWLHIHSSDD